MRGRRGPKRSRGTSGACLYPYFPHAGLARCWCTRQPQTPFPVLSDPHSQALTCSMSLFQPSAAALRGSGCCPSSPAAVGCEGCCRWHGVTLACPCRVVLSVNDKWHYCQNSDILVGSRAMRDRHLRLLGYCLVQVSGGCPFLSPSWAEATCGCAVRWVTGWRAGTQQVGSCGSCLPPSLLVRGSSNPSSGFSWPSLAPPQDFVQVVVGQFQLQGDRVGDTPPVCWSHRSGAKTLPGTGGRRGSGHSLGAADTSALPAAGPRVEIKWGP